MVDLTAEGVGLAASYEAARLLDDVTDKTTALLTVLDRLQQMAGTADVLEFRAVVASDLALFGVVTLLYAQDQVLASREAGRIGWPLLHLAETAVDLQEYALALESVHGIPPRFFAGQDLEWREVELREIEARCYVGLGDMESARAPVRDVWHAMTASDAEEEYAVPRPQMLVEALLGSVDRPPGNESIQLLLELSEAVDLSAWFPPDVVRQIRAALHGYS